MYVLVTIIILMSIQPNFLHYQILIIFTCRRREKGSVAAWLRFIFSCHFSPVRHPLRIASRRAVRFMQAKVRRSNRKSCSYDYKTKQMQQKAEQNKANQGSGRVKRCPEPYL